MSLRIYKHHYEMTDRLQKMVKKKKNEDMISVDRREYAKLMFIENIHKLKEENPADYNGWDRASLKFFKKPLLEIEFEQAEILPKLHKEDYEGRFEEALDKCIYNIDKGVRKK